MEILETLVYKEIFVKFFLNIFSAIGLIPIFALTKKLKLWCFCYWEYLSLVINIKSINRLRFLVKFRFLLFMEIIMDIVYCNNVNIILWWSISQPNIHNFSQAVLCYVPQWLWNMCEGGLINALVMGMNHSLDCEENIQKKKSMLMVYLMQYRKVIRLFIKYFIVFNNSKFLR